MPIPTEPEPPATKAETPEEIRERLLNPTPEQAAKLPGPTEGATGEEMAHLTPEERVEAVKKRETPQQREEREARAYFKRRNKKAAKMALASPADPIDDPILRQDESAKLRGKVTPGPDGSIPTVGDFVKHPNVGPCKACGVIAYHEITGGPSSQTAKCLECGHTETVEKF